MVAVLKTAVGKLTGGSNPSLSGAFGKVREFWKGARVAESGSLLRS